MNRQTLRNLLRWSGLAVAIVGLIVGRIGTSASMFTAGRALVWIGLAMMVGGIIVRMFIAEP